WQEDPRAPGAEAAAAAAENAAPGLKGGRMLPYEPRYCAGCASCFIARGTWKIERTEHPFPTRESDQGSSRECPAVERLLDAIYPTVEHELLGVHVEHGKMIPVRADQVAAQRLNALRTSRRHGSLGAQAQPPGARIEAETENILSPTGQV